ncbi:MAG: O-antigen ligase family protein [Bacteroidota bacterium]
MKLPSPPFRQYSWRYQLLLLDFVLLLTGLVFSPPLLSIGLIGISVVGILDIPKGINPQWVKNIQQGLRDPFSWGVITLYLIMLFSVWQTQDWDYYFERLRIKLALLSLPISWWGLPQLAPRHRRMIIAFLAYLIAAVSTIVLINYVQHFTEIQQAISEGRAIPVPRNHIRYSLLVALATLGALELWRVKAGQRSLTWAWLAGYLFIIQHLLAVRSGLACAYVGIAAMLFSHLIQTKQWKFGVISLAFLIIVPFAAYQTVPSLKSKINYLKYELWLQQKDYATQAYSDAGRLTSIQYGLELWQDHPWMGVGTGNLRQEMDRLYAERLPGVEGKRPHNQYVSILAGSGIFGFILFMAASLLLVFGRGRWRDPVFFGVSAILFTSFMVENTLENSAGLGMFCFFLLFYRPDNLVVCQA